MLCPRMRQCNDSSRRSSQNYWPSPMTSWRAVQSSCTQPTFDRSHDVPFISERDVFRTLVGTHTRVLTVEIRQHDVMAANWDIAASEARGRVGRVCQGTWANCLPTLLRLARPYMPLAARHRACVCCRLVFDAL